MEFWPLFDIFHWGWHKNGPFWTKNSQTGQAYQRSKVVQKGLKGTKMVNLSMFGHLGSFWAHLDPFRPFQTNWTNLGLLMCFGAKKSVFVWIGPKGSRWAQKGPKSPKTLMLAVLVHLGPKFLETSVLILRLNTFYYTANYMKTSEVSSIKKTGRSAWKETQHILQKGPFPNYVVWWEATLT